MCMVEGVKRHPHRHPPATHHTMKTNAIMKSIHKSIHVRIDIPQQQPQPKSTRLEKILAWRACCAAPIAYRCKFQVDLANGLPVATARRRATAYARRWSAAIALSAGLRGLAASPLTAI